MEKKTKKLSDQNPHCRQNITVDFRLLNKVRPALGIAAAGDRETISQKNILIQQSYVSCESEQYGVLFSYSGPLESLWLVKSLQIPRPKIGNDPYESLLIMSVLDGRQPIQTEQSL
ncbi:hypothetical protein [Chlorobaculum sp. 24CR]|uniref:hypothetical protein n=1 Tax=Chlorobaculum sp. 24CR TaxID=2508878 RepID=UPI001430A4DE|nr:hypothetical protein [Chlorobaculum sp. 24CR]